tara:strand:- start:523 stop:765 length:243 start_codon:yes stop_codon:yes gene_type:complete
LNPANSRGWEPSRLESAKLRIIDCKIGYTSIVLITRMVGAIKKSPVICLRLSGEKLKFIIKSLRFLKACPVFQAVMGQDL